MSPIECRASEGVVLHSDDEQIQVSGEVAWVMEGAVHAVLAAYVEEEEHWQYFLLDDYPHEMMGRKGQGKVWFATRDGGEWEADAKFLGGKKDKVTTWSYSSQRGSPKVIFQHHDVIE